MDCWCPIPVVKTSVGYFTKYKYKVGRKTYYRDLPHPIKADVRSNGQRILVPCGRCPACRRRKQNEWAFRIMEEAKFSRLTAFVTLTYDDNNLVYSDSGIPTLDPKRLQKFFKDLRYNFSFRYFACGEYGDHFDRPHYHFVLFTNDNLSLAEIEEFIVKRWPDGFVKVESPVSAGRAKYCAKYSMKQVGFDYQDVVPPFARMSRRPGIGKQFLDSINVDRFRQLQQWHVHDYQGTPYTLPRYYKERIYSKDEIEQHSLLLERVKFAQDDIVASRFENYHDYSQYMADVINNRERLFIAHLKKENYGFKYKPKKYEFKPKQDMSDLITDEF